MGALPNLLWSNRTADATCADLAFLNLRFRTSCLPEWMERRLSFVDEQRAFLPRYSFCSTRNRAYLFRGAKARGDIRVRNIAFRHASRDHIGSQAVSLPCLKVLSGIMLQITAKCSADLVRPIPYYPCAERQARRWPDWLRAR